MRKIGLQLYTVRESLVKNAAETLHQVARAGYSGVELFQHSGAAAPALLFPHLGALGLKVIGGHVTMDTVADWQTMTKTAAEYAKNGAKHLALAWVAPELRGGVAAWTSIAHTCNEAGKIAREHGLTFSYHNHDFEFTKVEDGRTGHQVLMDESDPALVKAELDLFWVQKAGLDVVEVLKHLGSRVSVVHVKDMTGDEKHTFEIVGDGIMDFDKILPVAEQLGADWFIVEQDLCPKGEIESIRASHENIVKRHWN